MKYQPPYGITDPNANYINGDPSIARKGSILPAAAAEFPQREIVNYIDSSDIVPSDGDLFQLTRAARSQWVNFCIDTGSTNALSVSLDPPLTAYKQGVPLRVLCSNNNTGPTTINVNSLGARPVKRASGSQLQPDDIRVGMIALLVDDGTAFQLVNYLGAIGGTTNNYTIDIPYAEDTSTSPNTVLANFGSQYGAVPAVAGDLVLVKLNNTNSGPVMLTVSSLAPKPIYRNDGQPLEGQDTLKAECILIEYNTTYWQMLRLVRSQVIFKLKADLTLYVRLDGNDTTGDGSTNTSAKAFRTVQRAIDYVRGSFLIAGRTVRIVLGQVGTYGAFAGFKAGAVITDLPGSLVIQGGTNPSINTAQSYVMVSEPNTAVVGVSGAGSQLSIIGLTMSLTTQWQYCLECDYNASCSIQDCWFSGAQAGAHIAVYGGAVTISGTIHFWSNAQTGIAVGGNGSFTAGLWSTTIGLHGEHYYNAFIQCGATGYAQITYGYCFFSGYATGTRYIAYGTAVILTGGGPYYLPGNVDGLVGQNGVYI